MVDDTSLKHLIKFVMQHVVNKDYQKLDVVLRKIYYSGKMATSVIPHPSFFSHGLLIRGQSRTQIN